jgi:2-keto-4-pentenoate hydratase/2-oxohepta-3-ene-1,7-dioic acid hydratase in catechol pathway
MTVLDLPYSGGSYRLAPSKVIALGLNYRDHIQESVSVKVRGFDPVEPTEPVLFPKLPSSIIGNEAAIRLPDILRDYDYGDDERTDYEGELALIIGRGGRNIPIDSAMNHVFGLTCANDVSQRNVQNGDRSGWFRGKSFDTFLPMGPRVVLVSEIESPSNLTIRTWLNGRVVQESTTGAMIFPPAETVHYVSRNFTLAAGDVILTGTPSGVGPLRHGDSVTVEIETIGRLTNSVVDPRHDE